MKKVLIGLVIGFISGMFSAGGGLILVPVCTYFLKMNEKEERATLTHPDTCFLFHSQSNSLR